MISIPRVISFCLATVLATMALVSLLVLHEHNNFAFAMRILFSVYSAVFFAISMHKEESWTK